MFVDPGTKCSTDSNAHLHLTLPHLGLLGRQADKQTIQQVAQIDKVVAGSC